MNKMKKFESTPEKKAASSLKVGIASIIVFIVNAVILYEYIYWHSVDLVIHMRNGTDWLNFLIFLPSMAFSGYGLILGVEGLKSSKRLYALCGILFSSITLLIFIFVLTAKNACC